MLSAGFDLGIYSRSHGNTARLRFDELLWSLGRLGDPVIDGDNGWVVRVTIEVYIQIL
jgi:hypothetical protein